MSQRLEQRQAPERCVTGRLTLRRPRTTDAAAILQSYAGDPDVTRLLAWPRHRSIADMLAFAGWSDQVWRSTPTGCGCRELSHVMRPADTRVPGHRGGLVVAAERSLRGAGEWALRAGADAASGANGGCCSAR